MTTDQKLEDIERKLTELNERVVELAVTLRERPRPCIWEQKTEEEILRHFESHRSIFLAAWGGFVSALAALLISFFHGEK